MTWQQIFEDALQVTVMSCRMQLLSAYILAGNAARRDCS